MDSLHTAKPGSQLTVLAIDGDGRFIGRITSIGITLGSTIQVVQNQKRQPVLVYARDTMIAINRKDCERIFVEEVSHE